MADDLKKKAKKQWAATHDDGRRAGKEKRGKMKPSGPEKEKKKGLFRLLNQIVEPQMLNK